MNTLNPLQHRSQPPRRLSDTATIPTLRQFTPMLSPGLRYIVRTPPITWVRRFTLIHSSTVMDTAMVHGGRTRILACGGARHSLTFVMMITGTLSTVGRIETTWTVGTGHRVMSDREREDRTREIPRRILQRHEVGLRRLRRPGDRCDQDRSVSSVWHRMARM